MWRVWVVWASVCAVGSVRAASLSRMPAEHRTAPLPAPPDILSGLPSATPDMFMWNSPDGSYRFGYQGLDQWRVESRDADGNVQGRYVYRTPDGQTVDVSYDAGPQGYRARGAAIPGGSAPLLDPYQSQGSDPEVLLKQAQQQKQEEEEQQLASPYGALLLTGVKETRPSGDGIDTFSDNNNLAVVTDIQLAPQRQVAVFPIVYQPGLANEISGPLLINDRPVLPGAEPV